jgi:hypothetical protein
MNEIYIGSNPSESNNTIDSDPSESNNTTFIMTLLILFHYVHYDFVDSVSRIIFLIIFVIALDVYLPCLFIVGEPSHRV